MLVKLGPQDAMLGFLLFAVTVESLFNGHAGMSA